MLPELHGLGACRSNPCLLGDGPIVPVEAKVVTRSSSVNINTTTRPVIQASLRHLLSLTMSFGLLGGWASLGQCTYRLIEWGVGSRRLPHPHLWILTCTPSLSLFLSLSILLVNVSNVGRFEDPLWGKEGTWEVHLKYTVDRSALPRRHLPRSNFNL